MRERGTRPRARLLWATAATALLTLTAATGCDTSGGAPGAKHTAASPSPTRSAPLWNPHPESIAAVGDSVTRGFDACAVLSDCPEASWATGSDPRVRSLAVRLLGPRAAAERGWNHAVTGARVADLPAQIGRAAVHSPELVTVMIGANDACRATASSMTSVSAFRKRFQKAMTVLRTALPRTQVYVSSVPDLLRLWSQGRADPLGKEVWKLGICPSMLRDADDLTASAEARRGRVEKRVEAYNTVLREVCARDRRCRFDGNAVFDYRFGTGQLSQWDWFHPSVDGQSRLAEIAYRTVTADSP
ncbi:SGNH/GDSL hydrolase family protein [Streptomyces sp. J2-1]|uniref:SGNH/GDSL hydrolase family protein n=1 Tax=Streptomyces corallincola TaxID=2851888 RepID=UPI001C3881EC|nr:SGNH/GDSL hydrolase family protein [Streptomyces corallincola]MBV2353796.1 SGNH/GDSL hydrolase family protein [Streptomyces corallincola]